MYELRIDRTLKLTHALRLYDGIVEPVHEHQWRVSAVVTSGELDQIGAVMDFNELARIIDAVCAPLQGRLLNDLPMFKEKNPSSEHVADYVFESIAPHLPPNVSLERVTITRTELIDAPFTRRR